MDKFNEKIKYKYSEIERAKMIYETGFKGTFILTEMKLVVLYMRDILNYKPAKIKEEFTKFCEKYFYGFNMGRDYQKHKSALDYADNKKNKLIVIESIPVYKEEFDFINSQSIDQNQKKVLFAFLIQVKLNKEVYFIKRGKMYDNICFKGNKERFNEIKKISKIPLKIDLHSDTIHNLYVKELLEPTYNGEIQLSFLNKIPEIKSSEPLFLVKQFYNAGWYFDYYSGQPRYKLCKECGQPFIYKSNSHDYCEEHKPIYEPIVTKKITCDDCGKEFEVSGNVKKQIRCKDCNKIKQLEWQKNSMNKLRNKD